MDPEPQSFKRVVVGMQTAVPEQALQLAVHLADLMHLELLGVFLDDSGLRELAGVPFVRELRIGGRWEPLDLERLSRDLEAAARRSERQFMDAVRRLTTKCRFEVLRGPTTRSIAQLSRIDDLIVIGEPVGPAGRSVQQFTWLLQAALRSAASVMLVPRRMARTTGPVIALAVRPDDPSISAAAKLATTLGESLAIVEFADRAGGTPRIERFAADLGIQVKHMVVGRASLDDPAACLRALAGLRERLVVMTRGAVDDALAVSVAAAHDVPVLLVEGAKPAGELQSSQT